MTPLILHDTIDQHAVSQIMLACVCTLMHGHLTQGREDAYTYQLTTQDVAELTSAVAKVKSTGVSTEEDILKVCTTLALHTVGIICYSNAQSIYRLHDFTYFCLPISTLLIAVNAWHDAIFTLHLASPHMVLSS